MSDLIDTAGKYNTLSLSNLRIRRPVIRGHKIKNRGVLMRSLSTAILPERQWWAKKRSHAIARKVMARVRHLKKGVKKTAHKNSARSHRTRYLNRSVRTDILAEIVVCVEQTLNIQITRHQVTISASMLLGHVQTANSQTDAELALILAACHAAYRGHYVQLWSVGELRAQQLSEQFSAVYTALGVSFGVLNQTSLKQSYRKRDWQITHTTSRIVTLDFLASSSRMSVPIESLRGDVARLTAIDDSASRSISTMTDIILVEDVEQILIRDIGKTISMVGEGEFIDEEFIACEALALCQVLKKGRDFQCDKSNQTASLTQTGVQVMAQLRQDYSGSWQNIDWSKSVIERMLTAVHIFHSGQDYNATVQGIQPITDQVAVELDDYSLAPTLRHLLMAKEGMGVGGNKRVLSHTTPLSVLRHCLWIGGVSLNSTNLEQEFWLNHGLILQNNLKPSRRPIRRFASEIVSKNDQLIKEVCDRTVQVASHQTAVLIVTRSSKLTQELIEAFHQRDVEVKVFNGAVDSSGTDNITDLANSITIIRQDLLVEARYGLVFDDNVRSAEVLMCERLDAEYQEQIVLHLPEVSKLDTKFRWILSLEDCILTDLHGVWRLRILSGISKLFPRISGRLAIGMMNKSQLRHEREGAKARSRQIQRDDLTRRIMAFTDRAI